MQAIVITEEQWQQLSEKLDTLKKDIEELTRPKREYINHKELLELFNLSDMTIRRWRDEGKLGYSQPSKKCFMYKWSDIQLLIDNNYLKPFAIRK